MLRDKNLIPLSRQHQHALALCVRIDRAFQAGKPDPDPWQAEIQQIWESEISVHFAAEEKELFPAASNFPQLLPLVQELLAEHTRLRGFFTRAAARTLDPAALQHLGENLSTHIRKEERQLFETLQKVMTPQQLDALGQTLDQALKNASHTCLLPNEATRLQPKP